MYEDSYQSLGQDYLEHYGVKGMRWGKHVKKKNDDERVVLRDVVPFYDPKTKTRGTIRVGNGTSGYANVSYLDEDGQLIKAGDFSDKKIPTEAKAEAIRKLSTMEVAKKKFNNKNKTAISSVGKTKMSSLNSKKMKSGKDKMSEILGKIKNKLAKKTSIKTTRK